MKGLPGFRDFYPEDAARRQYVWEKWRSVAERYGFSEYDGPTLESTDLYSKKNESGAEILQQLYNFQDKGDRDVALRPEMTPTLARMVAAREKNYRKPMKWFSMGPCFRYERQQKGRLREFLQLNCDILGDGSNASDSEMIALAIDLMREFGFAGEDFVVRVSSRKAWMDFLVARGVSTDLIPSVLQAADKLERDHEDALNARLAPAGLSCTDLRAFIAGGSPEAFAPLLADLKARGLDGFVEIDLSIVRGLAYYTGLVFEVFDKSRSMRALAGGGRYDGLIAALGDGSVDMPAIGFGMGDVVLSNYISEHPAASAALNQWLEAHRGCDVAIILVDEAQRPEALGVLQTLRDQGFSVELPFQVTKVGKQFQAAEQSGARYAVVIGSEWPLVKLKHLATRTETQVSHSELAQSLRKGQEHGVPGRSAA